MGGLLPDAGCSPRSSARWINTYWELTFKWARFSHANKPTRWVVGRYYNRFNKARQDRWVFGDGKTGAYLHKFAWTSIVRHQIVDGTASPDDPALADYWAKRRHKAPLPIDKTSRWLIKAQDGRCPICRTRSCPTMTGHKPHTSGKHGWRPPGRRSRRSSSERTARRTSVNPVSYTSTAATAVAWHFCPPTSLRGLLEPGARKRARPGSEGGPAQQCAGPTVRCSCPMNVPSTRRIRGLRPAAAISIGTRLVPALAGRLRSGQGAGLAASARLGLISIAGPAVGPVTRQQRGCRFRARARGVDADAMTRNDLGAGLLEGA